MNKKVYGFTIGILLILAVLLLLTSITLAQSDDGYDLSWWTVDGGGSSVGAGSPSPYTLDGTIGQPDAGVWKGNNYTLTGGFWIGGIVERRIYLPLVLRNS